VGLRQKEYCLYNEQLTREQYEEFSKNPKLDEEKFNELRLKTPHKNLEITQSEDCLGDYISNCKNCYWCFDIMGSEDCRYVWDAMTNTSYDCFNCGGDEGQGFCNYLYNSLAGYYSTNLKCCNKCAKSSDLSYCDYCTSCDSCFGCVGLHHKNYCILNKQYTKEQYQELLPRIIEHMEHTGEWCEFFPRDFSACGYNDSMAQYYFPLTKEQALAKGFNWSDYQKPALDDPSAIKCQKDGKLFRIIPKEKEFYEKHGLPMPTLCPDCRNHQRRQKQNPRQICSRKCDSCGLSIFSTCKPNRPEKIYCETCYLKSLS